MATGYTSGILDGKIKTFQQYAKQCMRAMGATIHMRDDDWDAPYRPSIPDTYYFKKINELKKEIEKLNKISDDELIKEMKINLSEEKINSLKYISEKKENEIKYRNILSEVQKYEPPTSDHIGIKTFMIDQIEQSIKWDCDSSYYEERILEIERSLENINPDEIRRSRLEDYNDDLRRAERNYKEEVDRCNNRNEWVRIFLESIK